MTLWVNKKKRPLFLIHHYNQQITIQAVREVIEKLMKQYGVDAIEAIVTDRSLSVAKQLELLKKANPEACFEHLLDQWHFIATYKEKFLIVFIWVLAIFFYQLSYLYYIATR